MVGHDWGAALSWLFAGQNPDLIEKMGNAGRKRVVENFTWDHFRERVHEAYRLANRLMNETHNG